MKSFAASKRWSARLTVLGLSLVLFYLSLSTPASIQAHALLVRSVPPNNARLANTPAQIEMWFSEPLESGFSGARLLNSRGEEVLSGPVQIDPADSHHMLLALEPLEPDIYTLAWQTLSQADGHPWYGSFPITILNPDGSSPTGTAPTMETERGELPTVTDMLARWLVLLGAMLLFGSTLFHQLIIRSATDSPLVVVQVARLINGVIWLGSGLIVVGSGLQLTSQALQLGGLTLIPALLTNTRTGTLILSRLILIFVGLAAGTGNLTNIRLQWVTVVAGAGILLTMSIGSHASAVAGRNWAVTIDFLHFLAAAAWLGGLVLFPLLIWRMRRATIPWEALWPLLHRFSYLAGLSVFSLATTGFLSSLIQLPTLTDLWTTAYGRTLSLKLILVGLTLLLALGNNRLVQRSAGQTVGRAARRLISAETCFALSIVLITAVLVQTPSPSGRRAQTAAAPSTPIFSQAIQADDLSAHIQILPNRVGDNQFIVHLYHEDNTAIGEVQLVRLYFNYQEAQLGQAQVDLKPDGDDIYQTQGAYLNQAGNWDVSLYVRRRGMDDLLTETGVDVAPAGSASLLVSPWKNPIPIRPIAAFLTGPLIAIGLVPFLWRTALRRHQPRRFSAISGLGLLCLLIGGLLLISVVLPWLAG